MQTNVIEDFAGGGGWSEALRMLGLTEVGYELNRDACRTAVTAGHARVMQDVTTVDRERHRGVEGYIASPPCQAWSKAGKRLGLLDQPRIFAHLSAVTRMDVWFDYPRDGWHDPRSPLVLEVARAILGQQPEWIALEQVPDVLPFWQAVAHWLRELGYRAWCGILHAERYGVPQTRKRVILTASRNLSHAIGAPPATHYGYVKGAVYETGPTMFGDGLLAPVSIAQALGWDGAVYRSTTMDNSARRSMDSPAPTIAFGHDVNSARWISARFGNQDHSVTRGMDEPAAAIRYGERMNACDWVMERPATTLVGSFRPDVIAAPGYRTHGGDSRQDASGSVRVSIAEASVLQSFRPDYPWQGSRTSQYQQIGNAVPPLLGVAVIGNLLRIDGWQHMCRRAYADPLTS